MRTNFVLIDYENVQPTDIELLDHHNFEIRIFTGANQNKISLELASSLQRMGQRAEYIKICGTGSNALDFHIAFYLGHLTTIDPGAYFHVISNDTGFDPLIQYLRDRHAFISRYGSIFEIPFIRAHCASSLEARTEIVIERIQKITPPRTVKTLSSTINSLFAKSLSEEEITMIIQELQRIKSITITDSKITYH